MQYCDDFQHRITKRDSSGWPEGLDDVAKQWLQHRILQELERSRGFGAVGLDLDVIADRVFSKDHPDNKDMPEKLRGSYGFDWRYGCVDRALRALECRRLWCVSNRDHARYEAVKDLSEKDLPPITVLTPQQRLALAQCQNPVGTDPKAIRANVRLTLVEGGYIEVRCDKNQLPRYYATYKGALMLHKIDKVTKEREAQLAKKQNPANSSL